MSYQIILKKRAQKELSSLPMRNITQIASVIDKLSRNPRPEGFKKLTGQKGWWRIRIGNYRILYSINDLEELITIFRIGHRKDIYKF